METCIVSTKTAFKQLNEIGPRLQEELNIQANVTGFDKADVQMC